MTYSYSNSYSEPVFLLPCDKLLICRTILVALEWLHSKLNFVKEVPIHISCHVYMFEDAIIHIATAFMKAVKSNYLCACARGKAIGFVCHRHCRRRRHHHKNCHISRYLGIWMTRKQNKLSKLAKNWFQYVSIPLAHPTSVTNCAFCWPCLSTVPTAGYVLSAYVHNWPGVCRQRSSTNTCMTLYINAAPAALRLMRMQRVGYVLWRTLVRL